MRKLAVLALFLAAGCGSDEGGTAGSGGGGTSSGGGAGGSGGSGGSGGGGGSAGSAGSGGTSAGGGSAGGGGASGGGTGGSAGSAPAPCDFDAPKAPPAGVLWAAPLAATGAATLGGHGHDDGKGPVGFCAGTKLAGQPFYRLVAAGFETDEDVNKNNQNDPLPVDFWKNATSFSGVGESGGRINVYVQIVDQNDKVLNVTTNPEIKIQKTILNGPTESLSLDSKPVNEFQTNFPMTGGGTRYGAAIEGASDRVINMRLPVNHHVTYVLVFRRENG